MIDYKFKIGDKVKILASIGYEEENNSYGEIIGINDKVCLPIYFVKTPNRVSEILEKLLEHV